MVTRSTKPAATSRRDTLIAGVVFLALLVGVGWLSWQTLLNPMHMANEVLGTPRP